MTSFKKSLAALVAVSFSSSMAYAEQGYLIVGDKKIPYTLDAPVVASDVEYSDRITANNREIDGLSDQDIKIPSVVDAVQQLDLCTGAGYDYQVSREGIAALFDDVCTFPINSSEKLAVIERVKAEVYKRPFGADEFTFQGELTLDGTETAVGFIKRQTPVYRKNEPIGFRATRQEVPNMWTAMVDFAETTPAHFVVEFEHPSVAAKNPDTMTLEEQLYLLNPEVEATRSRFKLTLDDHAIFTDVSGHQYMVKLVIRH